MKNCGLVLGGGGARGSYQVGVWRALIELNIEITSVVGTSIGAVNGAFISQGDYKSLEELWMSVKFSSCFKLKEQIDDNGKLSMKDIHVLIESALPCLGLDASPLKKILDIYLDENVLRNSPVDFGLVTLCLSTMSPLEIFKNQIPKGELTDYIMASCSLPGIKQEPIDGEFFIDGGLYSNIPTEMLINKDCSIIVTVDIDGPGIKRKVTNSNKIPIIKIKCSEDLGPIINFEHDIIIKNINLGYLDTLRTFGKLDGIIYFFNKKNRHSNTLLNNITIKELKLLLKSVNFTNRLSDKLIVNRTLKELKKLLGESPAPDTYLIMSMEITAEILNITHYKIYNYDELLDEILKEVNKITLENSTIKEHFIFRNCNLLDTSESILTIRRTLSITFPKGLIAHLFIALIKFRLSF